MQSIPSAYALSALETYYTYIPIIYTALQVNSSRLTLSLQSL